LVHGSSSSGPLRAFEASLTKDHDDESETGAHLDTLLRSAGSYRRCARVVNRKAHDVIGKLSR